MKNETREEIKIALAKTKTDEDRINLINFLVLEEIKDNILNLNFIKLIIENNKTNPIDCILKSIEMNKAELEKREQNLKNS